MRDIADRLGGTIYGMTREAEKIGYEKAMELNRKQLQDVEELLGKERKKRERLENERMVTEIETRVMLRDELDMALGKRSRKWVEER